MGESEKRVESGEEVQEGEVTAEDTQSWYSLREEGCALCPGLLLGECPDSY